MRAKQVVILTPSASAKFGNKDNQNGQNGFANEGLNTEISSSSNKVSSKMPGENKKFGKNEEVLLDA